MKSAFAVALVALAVIGWTFAHRYEFHTAAQATLYRCDRWTGRVDFTGPGGTWERTTDTPRPATPPSRAEIPVEVPGRGTIHFPGELTDEQIAGIIRQLSPTTPAAEEFLSR